MRKSNLKRGQPEAPFRITRRQLLAGVGAATIVGSIGTVGLARKASAMELHRALPSPLPIPGGVDAPPVGFIHIFTPGPTTATTPYLGLPGEGLDVEPSTITNFQGFTAYAILSGQAEGRDGKSYNVEVDMRVMEGEYIAEDGSNQHGVFALF